KFQQRRQKGTGGFPHLSEGLRGEEGRPLVRSLEQFEQNGQEGLDLAAAPPEVDDRQRTHGRIAIHQRLQKRERVRRAGGGQAGQRRQGASADVRVALLVKGLAEGGGGVRADGGQRVYRGVDGTGAEGLTAEADGGRLLKELIAEGLDEGGYGGLRGGAEFSQLQDGALTEVRGDGTKGGSKRRHDGIGLALDAAQG